MATLSHVAVQPLLFPTLPMRPGHDSVRDTPDFAAGPSSFSSRSWKAHAQAQTQKRRSTVMGTARGVLPRRMTSGLFSYQAGAYACCGGVLTLIALLATGSLMWGPPPTSGMSPCSCCKAWWPVGACTNCAQVMGCQQVCL